MQIIDVMLNYVVDPRCHAEFVVDPRCHAEFVVDPRCHVELSCRSKMSC